MTLFVNDKPYEAPASVTLLTILDTLELTALRGIAVAVNDEVVARSEWFARQLAEQDRLLIIRATQGG